VNLKEVSEELRARYIVEGSVRKGGQRVRITAQLIDAEQDHHLWSEKWDKNLEDIFDIQDEVSASIAGQINPTLEDYERERVERIKPTNYNAWETYLKSLHIFNNRNPSDHEDIELKKALKLCEKAIKLDHSLSLAYSLLAKICEWELLQFTTEDSKKTLKDMLSYAKKAEELDSKNPIAAYGIARHYFFSGKFEQAKFYSERAIQLNPSYPDAQNILGQSLVHSGNFIESEKHFLKAIELNPLDPNAILYKDGLYFAQMGLGNYETAYLLIEECISQFSKAGFYKGFRAAVLGYLDRDTEAKNALNEYLSLRPNLKTKEDYKRIFVNNSSLADILIEGLCRAGWKPED
jgi:tetratricopeptide (TPR) repeat protein